MAGLRICSEIKTPVGRPSYKSLAAHTGWWVLRSHEGRAAEVTPVALQLSERDLHAAAGGDDDLVGGLRTTDVVHARGVPRTVVAQFHLREEGVDVDVQSGCDETRSLDKQVQPGSFHPMDGRYRESCLVGETLLGQAALNTKYLYVAQSFLTSQLVIGQWLDYSIKSNKSQYT